MSTRKDDLIRRIPLFRDCTDAEITEIALTADELDLPAGKKIVTEGARGLEFIVIVEGSAEVLKQGEPVATLGPTDFVGEIALLTGERRNATVVATTPLRVLVIARHRFVGLVERVPEIRTKVEAALAARTA